MRSRRCTPPGLSWQRSRPGSTRPPVSSEIHRSYTWPAATRRRLGYLARQALGWVAISTRADGDVVGGSGRDAGIPQLEARPAAVMVAEYCGDRRVVDGVGQTVAADEVPRGVGVWPDAHVRVDRGGVHAPAEGLGAHEAATLAQRRGSLSSMLSWTTLAMLAHAFLAVATAIERDHTPTPDGLIELTVNEFRRLFDALLLAAKHTIDTALAWSRWRRRHQARARGMPLPTSPTPMITIYGCSTSTPVPVGALSAALSAGRASSSAAAY